MKNSLLITAVLLLSPLGQVGCDRRKDNARQTAVAQSSRDAALPRTTPSDAMDASAPKASDITKNLLAIEAMLAPIAPNTPKDHPSVALVRQNIEGLAREGRLDHFYLGREALKNPEIARLLWKHYQQVREKGGFWSNGIPLLGMTGDKTLAPELWKQWNEMAPYTRPDVMGWDDYAKENQHPKFLLARAIFKLDSQTVIDEALNSLPRLTTGEQLVLAKSAEGSASAFTASRLLSYLDEAKSKDVREAIVGSVNSIFIQLFSNPSAADRAAMLQQFGDSLAVMEKRGLIQEHLAKLIRNAAQ